jgi:hypothetical protein
MAAARLARQGYRSATAALFLGAGAQRKLRYARLLVEAVDLEECPSHSTPSADAH